VRRRRDVLRYRVISNDRLVDSLGPSEHEDEDDARHQRKLGYPPR
jgi:hypothetical protein